MTEKYTEVEKLLISQMNKEADEIEQEVTQSTEGKPGAERINRIKNNIDEQIKQIEVEKLISQLPEAEQKALKLGREVLKDKEQKTENEETEKKVKYRKKKWKMYVGIAAALTVFLAVGVTSLGGAERVARFMKSIIGDREINQVDSNENNIISAEEKEEEAYQKIKDELGIDPVRIVIRPPKFYFQQMHIDQKLQTAELLYEYKDETVGYYISLSFADSSWGLDAEDEIIDQWVENVGECPIDVIKYVTPQKSGERYLAHYKYKQVEYFLNATMPLNEFKKIINNLHFI